MNNRVLIRLEKVSKSYKLYDSPSHRMKEALNFFGKKYHKIFFALKNINLKIKQGESVGIIGINGAGKSTLLKIIANIIQPTIGKVAVNGKISALIELSSGFNPEFTGIENVHYLCNVKGIKKSNMDVKVKRILEFADIGEYIKQPVKTYSSGMLARLAFSIEAFANPDIFIVDEALSVGDIFFQQKCYQHMKELLNNTTRLIVSHNLSSISTLVDRVIVLNNGIIIFDGPTKEGIATYIKTGYNKNETKNMKDIQKSTKENLKFDDYKPVKPHDLCGTLDIIIQKYFYEVNSYSYFKEIKKDDELLLSFIISSKKQVRSLIVGYIVRDKYGNNIFGENSLSFREELFAIENKNYLVNLKIKWPEIKPGDYFLTIGLGEGHEDMRQTVLCWSQNIIHLQNVVQHTVVHGIFNNPFEDVSILKL